MTLDRTRPLARRLSTLTLAVGVSAALIGGVGLTAGCSVIGSNPDRYSCTNPGRADVQTLLGVFFAPNADEKAERFRPTAWNAAVTAFLFLWCTFSLSGVSSFLYFQF